MCIRDSLKGEHPVAVLELLKTFELPPLFTVGTKKNRYEEDGDLLIPVDYNAHRKTITVQLSKTLACFLPGPFFKFFVVAGQYFFTAGGPF